MKILGISAFYHDSAACLIKDGEILAAAQEERFTRKKHDSSLPENAINFCLQSSGLSVENIDYVVFYEKPFIKFERLIETYLEFAPKGITSFLKSIPIWIKEKLWLKETIKKRLGFNGQILFCSHHESHAASAFFPSPFQNAAILIMDAVGEKATASCWKGDSNKIELLAEIDFPDSLGMLYSAFTYFCGFKVNSGEYKLMGLAPYGQPNYKDVILSKLIDLREDGSFSMNMEYFNYCTGLKMINKKFERLFGRPARPPEAQITQQDMDIARSIQDVTEEIVLKMANHIFKLTGAENLCLAGGVALNCVANSKILNNGPFKNIWIQPSSGDAGGALGAALSIYYQYLENKRVPDGQNDFQRGSYLGPEWKEQEIEKYLKEEKIIYTKLQYEEIPNKIADLINDQKVIGLFEGKMEFGPRALGNRSIIGDARSSEMQKIMNLKIKFRESFRPFAPAVLEDRAKDFFNIKCPSPYMLLTAPVKKEVCFELDETEKKLDGLEKLNVKRSEIPAVTHVDYSARLQTVNKITNPLFYSIIEAFDKKYGCPVIINTSFNVRGEPIVCSPKDAYLCFVRTNMDFLLIGSYLLDKKNQKILDKDSNWQKEFQLD